MFQADDWIKIAKDVPLNLAATLLVNPCTAYRMLKDFVQLKEGMYGNGNRNGNLTQSRKSFSQEATFKAPST